MPYFGSHRLAAALATLVLTACPATAQWRVLDTPSKADLSGISAIDEQEAWASGTAGTILRTENGGRTWQVCTAPPASATLNFSSIQAFDKDTAVVIATGSGSLSGAYKTRDGCRSWSKVLSNPDTSGSFRALRRATAFDLYLLGEPVDGKFVIYVSHDAGDSWSRTDDAGLAIPGHMHALVGGGGALTSVLSDVAFGTGGDTASVYSLSSTCKNNKCALGWTRTAPSLPQTAAIAAIAGRNVMVPNSASVTGIGTVPSTLLIAVGGNAAKPDEGSAAFSTDGGASWKPSSMPPGGYRSSIDFDGDRGRFIAVGPNGTDVSVDDGLVWQKIVPASGTDQGWTALSLPFAVGPQGRIGKLSSDR